MNEIIKYSLSVNKNIWHVSFRLTLEDGSKKQKCLSTGIHAGNSGKANKRQAEQAAAEIVQKYENLVYNNKSEMSVGAYVRDYVERIKPMLQHTTYDSYIHMITKHIEPYFTMTLRELKPLHIQVYINQMLNNGLSSNTVGKHYTLTRSALKDAVINDLIKSNPAEKVKKPKKGNFTAAHYETEQLKTLLNCVKGTKLELPVFFGCVFGLRRSEILGLRWSNIDLDTLTVKICKKVTRCKTDDGRWVDVESDTLKSTASKADYFLNSAIYDYLRQKRIEQEQMPRETNEYIDFVCVDEVGNRLKCDYVSAAFRKFLKEHNLPHIRFHELRHSCITYLSHHSDLTFTQVKGYARHSSIQQTALYAHNVDADKLIGLNAICTALDMIENL